MKIILGRIRKIIGAGFFMAIAMGAVVISGHVLRPVNTDIAVKQVDTFHSLPEDSVDVMVFGSSHAWRGVDSLTMYDDYGIGMYNYACNWQRANTTELFIKDALLTQSPKVILIESATLGKTLYDTDIVGEVYYTRGISEAADKQKTLYQYFGTDLDRYIGYYIPLIAFHDNWENITTKSWNINNSSQDFLATMGTMYTVASHPFTIQDYTKFPNKEYDEKSLAALDDIVELCEEQDIQIVFFTVPWACKKFAYLQAIENYAADKGIPYLNLFENYEEIGIDPQTDYYDYDHLNHSGAVKVSKYLGQYLKDNYELEDKRLEDDNLWEQAKKRQEQNSLPDDSDIG